MDKRDVEVQLTNIIATIVQIEQPPYKTRTVLYNIQAAGCSRQVVIPHINFEALYLHIYILAYVQPKHSTNSTNKTAKTLEGIKNAQKH